MEKFKFGAYAQWSTVLLISVIFTAFIVPVLPFHLHSGAFIFAYSIIYISAFFSLRKRSKIVIFLFIATTLMHWISIIFKLDLLYDISRGLNVLFFIWIVISLIFQIAFSREVSPAIILDSIAGYLLIGIMYSILIFFIIKTVPGAYSNQMGEIVTGSQIDASSPLYFSFVTFASLGYGDIVPLVPISRSLATFIAISGQFYIAIIVAMLVGKFASQQKTKYPN